MTDHLSSTAPVIKADTFRLRRRGLSPRPNGRRMLFEANSVHGFGMREAVWAVGLTRDGEVIEVSRLEPRRLVWLRGAHWILELPIDEEPPRPGQRMAQGSW